MPVTVSLRHIVGEIQMLGDEHTAYLNTRTSELITLSSEELRAAEEGVNLEDYPQWEQEIIEKAREVLS